MQRNAYDIYRIKSVIMLVITALLWSLGGVLIKSIAWNPIAIAGSRSVIAIIILLAVIRKPKFNWSAAQIGAAVAYAATVISFVIATKMTTAANAILLQYTAPIYIALLGTWFLNEKPRFLDWVTIFVALGGMLLFFADELKPGNIQGNLIALASGFSYAVFAMCMRKQKNGSNLESMLLGNILAALVGLPFMIGPVPDTSSCIFLLILAVVQLAIPYILYSIAVKHVTALESLMIPVIEPILNPVWVFLFIGEVPGIWAFAGGAIVIIAILTRCVVLVKTAGQNADA